jgi:hypothetical protein
MVMGRIFFLCWIVSAFLFPQILPAQNAWKIKNRLQAGVENDNNIFETPQNSIGTLAGRVLFSNQSQRRWAKTALMFHYAGALQFYPEYSEENKTIHDLSGSANWRLNDWLLIGGFLRGNAKIYFGAPFDFAGTSSGLSFGLQLPEKFTLTFSISSSRLDFAESDQFDFTSRHFGLKLQRPLTGTVVLESTVFFARLDYLRPALGIREQAGNQVLFLQPFNEEDEQVHAQLRLGFGRKFLARLGAEYLQNDANSFGYSYEQFRLSAITGIKPGKPWLLRLAAMIQLKNYREDIAPILQRTLDPESDESNFLVADLSYDYTSKLAYVVRLAFYKNEAAQRGRFYRKMQLFIGGEYRF